MNAIKRRFLFCLLGAVLSAAAALLFAFDAPWFLTLLLGAATILLALLTVRTAEVCRWTKLILENPLLRGTVPGPEGGGTAVVSGFGILLEGKPYSFRPGGVTLSGVEIDREGIVLSFGNGEKAAHETDGGTKSVPSFGNGEKAGSLRLLHGLGDRAEVEALTERLRYETGLTAEVRGWEIETK